MSFYISKSTAAAIISDAEKAVRGNHQLTETCIYPGLK